MATPKHNGSLSRFICQPCRQRLLAHQRRPFTTTSTRYAEDTPKSADSPISGLENLSSQINRSQNRPNPYNNATRSSQGVSYLDILDSKPELDDSFLSNDYNANFEGSQSEEVHRLHVYAHKHNTHITFVQPPRSAADTAHLRMAGTKTSATEQKKTVDTLLSLSTGNIGFKKAGRGSYDAAFQLAAFTLKQIQEKGMLSGVKSLEVVLRGFGAGREAVTKALLGTEGRVIRQRITSVVDATRLKQGGPRSKKPRRLG